MASLQAHLVSRYIRWRIKRPLIGHIDLLAARRSLERPYIGPIPHDVRITPGHGPVPGEWVEPRRSTPDAPVLLYLHGGGFFACSPATHRAITTGFARCGGPRVFAVDYRRAPEWRFPAALEDAAACCDWVLRETGRPVAAIAGDSAGGTLALSLLLHLRDTGRPLPACAALFSPVTDLAATGASIIENDRRDAMFFGASVARLREVYLPEGVSPRDPLASPLYADPAGLPPLLFHVGSDEVLRDDSTRFAAKARAAGVEVTLRLWPVVPHAWQLMGPWVPEGAESVRQARAFVLRYALSACAPSACAPSAGDPTVPASLSSRDTIRDAGSGRPMM